MRTLTIALLAFILLNGVQVTSAQESTEVRQQIEQLKLEKKRVREQEKNRLKEEVEAIQLRLDAGEISKEQAQVLKEEAARKRALNIENQLAIIDNQIELLERNAGDQAYSEPFIRFDWGADQDDDLLFGLHIGEPNPKKEQRYDRRTYHDALIAFGFNNAIIEGQSLEDSPYRFGGSRFFEIGYQWRTRVFRKSNWLRINYGFAFQFNGLKPEGNQYFVRTQGEPSLEVFPIELNKSKFRMDNLVAPVHFEFGTSRKKETEDLIRYSLRRQFRIGVGGYGGVNLGARQKLKFTEGGQDQKEKRVGDYNTSNIIYGLSTYAGIGGTTVYLKYDLTPIFQDAEVEQRNISLGLRFDL